MTPESSLLTTPLSFFAAAPAVTRYDVFIIASYLLFLASIGWIFKRFAKGTKDYFAGGHKMTWWLLGAGSFASNFSSWTFTGAAGIAHMAAVVGLVRGRTWGGALVAYLSAAGIAAAATTGLLAATGLEVFGAEPRTVLGTSIWMIGTWLVATRFAIKPFGFTPHAHRAAVRPARPTADTRPQTGLRKARPSRPVVLPTPRIVQPSPSRIVLRPLTTPTA